jgi:hypothetical protein
MSRPSRSGGVGFSTDALPRWVSTPLLTGIYTTLLKFLEQEIGQAVAPVASCSNPWQVVAISSEVVEAIASGDAQRAIAVAKRNRFKGERGLSDRKTAPPATLLRTHAALASGASRNVDESVNVHCVRPTILNAHLTKRQRFSPGSKNCFAILRSKIALS